MACPCKKDANTCNCTTVEECKCGDSCACENCAAKHQKKEKTCTCAATGKGIARI